MKSLIWAVLGMISAYCGAFVPDKIDIYTEHFPPYQFLGERGEVVGRATAMVQLLMAQTQIDYQIHVLPWYRAVQQAHESNTALLYSLARSTDREKHYQWIMPLCELKVGFYQRSGNVTPAPHYSLNNLKHYIVGVGTGQPSEQYLQNEGFKKSNLVSLSSLNQAGGLLEKGRIDFLFGAQSFVEQMAQAMGTEHKWKLVLSVPTLSAQLYLAAHKNAPKSYVKKLKEAAQAVQSAHLNRITTCYNSQYIQ
ncbi:substrate-binding periplasmic protein [Pseudoalteromonas sp. T1lg23B]|uniref:substrate-binding periplasmic protein n=1 Tax=Pseudoalteromonas sp. T1lg23B TaxID=2077097 RepID=UPI000CF737F3|nr:transporter substrate-binding domain-containing protein [Pseudoalteromonas sp. T1lg23B]